MPSKIKTAVLPAGGYGTRFLPTTKSIPKEMLPLDSKPIILHVVEEAVAAGIENIIFVVSHHKNAIEKLFAPDEALENYYEHLKKADAVKELKKISKLAHFTFVYTEWPYGNGGALLSARHLLDSEPFVLVWTDEIILSRHKSRMQQCLEAYDKFNLPVISMIEIADPSRRKHYGMADLVDFSDDRQVKQIKKVVEKPALGREPSKYAAHGAYVFTAEVFEIIDQMKLRPQQELWLTDIVNQLAKKSPVLGKIILNGAYLDCGNPLNYLYSQIDYALEFSDYRKELKAFIRNKLGCPLPDNAKFNSVFQKKAAVGRLPKPTKRSPLT